MTGPTTCPICVEMVQYTPRRDGMTLQISATDPAHPLSALIGQSRQIQTTQRAIAGDEQAALADVTWSDDSVEAAAIAYWAAFGISVSIVSNYLPGDEPKEAPADVPADAPVPQDSPAAQEPPL
jgi:hypothetical protein